jgi:hypothetical protein
MAMSMRVASEGSHFLCSQLRGGLSPRERSEILDLSQRKIRCARDDTVYGSQIM